MIAVTTDSNEHNIIGSYDFREPAPTTAVQHDEASVSLFGAEDGAAAVQICKIAFVRPRLSHVLLHFFLLCCAIL
jgi:hypothetical protein